MAVFPKVLGGADNNVHSVDTSLNGLLGVTDVASNVCRILLEGVYKGTGGGGRNRRVKILAYNELLVRVT
jgi:hypothetical protein